MLCFHSGNCLCWTPWFGVKRFWIGAVQQSVMWLIIRPSQMKVSTRALMLPFPELIPADGLGMKMQWRRRHSSVAGNARENMSNNKQAVTSGTSRIMFKIPSDSWKTSWRRENDRFFHRIWLEYVRFHMGSLLTLGSAIHLRSAVHYQSVHQRKLPYISCFQVKGFRAISMNVQQYHAHPRLWWSTKRSLRSIGLGQEGVGSCSRCQGKGHHCWTCASRG